MQCVARRIIISQRAIRPVNPAERYALIHRYFTTHRLNPLTRPPASLVHERFKTPVHSLRHNRTYSNANNASRHEKSDPNKEEHTAQDADHSSSTPHYNPENWSPFYRRLAKALPHTVRRPTSEDFLKITDSFWARTRIRFKWFTIRSFRRFGVDDFSAFITWFLMSQTLWILVGTCVLFSSHCYSRTKSGLYSARLSFPLCLRH
jgi:hypothetical protein